MVVFQIRPGTEVIEHPSPQDDGGEPTPLRGDWDAKLAADGGQSTRGR